LSTLLLDASAILAAFDTEDDLHESASAILVDPEITLATLDLARYEVTNVAIRAWRAPDRVATLLDAIDRIADDGGILSSTTALLTRAAQLADEHVISAYDAAYVAAANHIGAMLISCDIRDLVSKELASSPAQVHSEIVTRSAHKRPE
jgi:predicted nucleic acid-binding protein